MSTPQPLQLRIRNRRDFLTADNRARGAQQIRLSESPKLSPFDSKQTQMRRRRTATGNIAAAGRTLLSESSLFGRICSRRSVIGLLVAVGVVAGVGCGTVLPTTPLVTISPASASVQAGGGTQQFTATVTGAGTTSVTWKVDGVYGGNAVEGTVTQDGLYHAPEAVPAGPVDVEAVSAADGNVIATAA